jgi:hypothetical protein
VCQSQPIVVEIESNPRPPTPHTHSPAPLHTHARPTTHTRRPWSAHGGTGASLVAGVFRAPKNPAGRAYARPTGQAKPAHRHIRPPWVGPAGFRVVLFAGLCLEMDVPTVLSASTAENRLGTHRQVYRLTLPIFRLALRLLEQLTGLRPKILDYLSFEHARLKPPAAAGTLA